MLQYQEECARLPIVNLHHIHTEMRHQTRIYIIFFGAFCAVVKNYIRLHLTLAEHRRTFLKRSSHAHSFSSTFSSSANACLLSSALSRTVLRRVCLKTEENGPLETGSNVYIASTVSSLLMVSQNPS